MGWPLQEFWDFQKADCANWISTDILVDQDKYPIVTHETSQSGIDSSQTMNMLCLFITKHTPIHLSLMQS